MFFFKRSKKVLILPVNTGGTIFYIRDAIRSLNYEPQIITFTKHPFGYEKNKFIFNQNSNFLERELRKIFALRYYFLCKNIIFNYGRTIFMQEFINKESKYFYLKIMQNFYYKIMQRIEISINKLLDNRLIFIYSGDDARQSEYCLKNFFISPAHYLRHTSYYTESKDNIKRNNIKIINKIAYSIYSVNPDIMNVLPKRTKFLPYPYRLESDSYNIKNNKTLKIAHVPSHRGVKGTKLIIDKIKNLKINKPELNINLTILENIDHSELLRKLEDFDLVIDQILVGWYGSIAVESMAKGIPVMAYLRNKDMKFVPIKMQKDMPIINISINNLEKKIIEFCKFDQEELFNLSKRSKEFVRNWHSLNYCAESLKDDLF
tara:strand:+ start:1286 stop:2410 length:1125 start_codon:yes stop_codon:yes gene_type:complete